MRRSALGMMAGVILAVAGLLAWGTWTWRLSTANQRLSLALEAERQRNFADMTYHVEQIQTLLGKGRVAGSTRQSMRYMGDVYHHSLAAAANFASLPLPPGVQAATGKFLQQTGDFARVLLRNEAAGHEMAPGADQELGRLRVAAQSLSDQLHAVSDQYSQGTLRWNNPDMPPKPATGAQAPANLLPGWEQVGSSMEKLPVFLYDGPFSDAHVQRTPAMSGPVITQDDAARKLAAYLPDSAKYSVVGVAEAGGQVPAWSFRLAPAGVPAGPSDYSTVVEVSKNGGYLLQMLNWRAVGKPVLDLLRARDIGRAYLALAGLPDMAPTYGQVEAGVATIAYAFQENGVIIYPDQAKVKVALDTGEVIGADARAYLISHHTRTLSRPRLSSAEAEEALKPDLAVKRVQLALIPGPNEVGEILTYEFLTTLGSDTFLVYVNAETGHEEIILQQVETDGGTFAL